MIVNRLSAVKHPEPTGLSRSGSARVAEAGIKFPECPADPRSSLLRPPVASGKPRELRVGAHDVVVGTTVRLVGGRHPQPPRENTKARCTDWGDGNREREVAWSLDGNPHSLRPFAFSSGIELKRDMGALGKSQRDVLPPEPRSEEHTSELQSRLHLVCRLLLEKKKPRIKSPPSTITVLGRNVPNQQILSLRFQVEVSYHEPSHQAHIATRNQNTEAANRVPPAA